MGSPSELTFEEPISARQMVDFAKALKDKRHDATRDFEIVCGEETLKVHRLVLSLHSKYFRRLCDGSFKGSTERKITLHDDPFFAVKATFHYLYEFNYAAQALLPLEASTGLADLATCYELHAQVFSIAEKCDILGLNDKALANFQITMYGSVEEQDAEAVALVSATRHVYQVAPPNDRRLRDELMLAWKEDDWLLLKNAQASDFEKLLAEIPESAADLVAAAIGARVGGAINHRLLTQMW